MTKPRVFVSSTCYDLADLRAALKEHLADLFFEPLLSDSPEFGVAPKTHSHDACLKVVELSDYFVLIIGGRRGGTYVGSEKSITNEEYRQATRLGIPVMTFVRRSVLDAQQVFRSNPGADLTAFVDDKRVFDFLQMVQSASDDNWVRPFNDVNDIKQALTAQFAFICLQYSRSLRSKGGSDDHMRRPVAPLPPSFSVLMAGDKPEVAAYEIQGLKKLHRIIESIETAEVSGKPEKIKTLWVFGRHAETGIASEALCMHADRFKQRAWGTQKGKSVFNQLKDFRVSGVYHLDEDEPSVCLAFDDQEDGDIAHALRRYVKDLLAACGDDESLAMERFARAAMDFYHSGAPEPSQHLPRDDQKGSQS